ncbi:MAG: hypothetical protein LBV67_07585 [Streptococcaceae bacterium]|nr:hypothetical protein [Streptococcaceae bacterium]
MGFMIYLNEKIPRDKFSQFFTLAVFLLIALNIAFISFELHNMDLELGISSILNAYFEWWFVFVAFFIGLHIVKRKKINGRIYLWLEKKKSLKIGIQRHFLRLFLLWLFSLFSSSYFAFASIVYFKEEWLQSILLPLLIISLVATIILTFMNYMWFRKIMLSFFLRQIIKEKEQYSKFYEIMEMFKIHEKIILEGSQIDPSIQSLIHFNFFRVTNNKAVLTMKYDDKTDLHLSKYRLSQFEKMKEDLEESNQFLL